MKAIIIDAILIAISIITVSWFKWYVKKKYGKRPSISNSAKYLTQDGNQIYFFAFIILGLVSLMYVGRTFLLTFAAMIISGTGTITGYNEEMEDRELQDMLHCIYVFISIAFFGAGMIFLNIWLVIPIGICAITCLIIWLKRKQISCHTWKIEVLILHCVWLCLIIQRIILPIIKML